MDLKFYMEVLILNVLIVEQKIKKVLNSAKTVGKV